MGQQKIIAVDFDGTLCENKFPQIGKARHSICAKVLKEQQNGAKLILWTCRVGERLEEAIEWCESRGIIFDAHNANLPETLERFGSDCRKVFANEYWDDKAVEV